MIKRVKRLADFDLSLVIKNDNFINPPRSAQRNWLLNKSMNEFASDVQALDRHAKQFVKGSEALQTQDRTQADLADTEIMEDWQIPIMKAMAEIVTSNEGDILEIGFGRGIGSSLIQQAPINSHTIIECNDAIIARFYQWQQQYLEQDIRLIHGLWQDRLPSLAEFDGIFFHTYPLKEHDFVEQIAESCTFAEHFFEHAGAHLREGGIFTYLSNEIDSLSRTHQRKLLQYFSKIELSCLSGLNLPEDVQDQWWSDSMMIVKAVK